MSNRSLMQKKKSLENEILNLIENKNKILWDIKVQKEIFINSTGKVANLFTKIEKESESLNALLKKKNRHLNDIAEKQSVLEEKKKDLLKTFFEVEKKELYLQEVEDKHVKKLNTIETKKKDIENNIKQLNDESIKIKATMDRQHVEILGLQKTIQADEETVKIIQKQEKEIKLKTNQNKESLDFIKKRIEEEEISLEKFIKSKAGTFKTLSAKEVHLNKKEKNLIVLENRIKKHYKRLYPQVNVDMLIN